MYVFTDEREIVNLDKFDGVGVYNCRVRGEDKKVVAATLPDNKSVRLAVFDDEKEARLMLQDIFTALDNRKHVFYIGSYIMPF